MPRKAKPKPIYIINRHGAIHLVDSAARDRELARGGRLATPAEIKIGKKTKTQDGVRPLFDPAKPLKTTGGGQPIVDAPAPDVGEGEDA